MVIPSDDGNCFLVAVDPIWRFAESGALHPTRCELLSVLASLNQRG